MPYTHFFAALLVAYSPTPGEVHDKVLAVEVNHLCSDLGEPYMAQLIAWGVSPTGELTVVDWAPLTHTTVEYDRHLGTGYWRVRFVDHWFTYRAVDAAALHESWTSLDPETADRVVTPQSERRRFSKPWWRAQLWGGLRSEAEGQEPRVVDRIR